MRVQAALSIADLTRLARRRLPRVLFETIESGVEDELCLRTNAAAFQARRLLPRHMTDVRTRNQTTLLFGIEHAAPFGIAPTGIAGVFRRDAELMLATAARDAGVPLILSGASMVAPERVAAIAPASTWFQLYPARDPAISHDLMRRVDSAGVRTLVLTVDNPVYPKRERDMRNGFGLPLRLSIPLVLDVLRHAPWLMDYWRGGGLPMMETWQPYAPYGASAAVVAQFFRSQSPTVQTWRDLEGLRRMWPHRMVLKGVLHPADAANAVKLGMDGIILSNHGGKALDRAPAPLDMLPCVRGAVPRHIPVMLDGGLRRGSDMVTAKCLGADFVFVGRPTLYGVAAGGAIGAGRALAILRDEIDLTLALVGCAKFAALGPDYLFDPTALEDSGRAYSMPAPARSLSR